MKIHDISVTLQDGIPIWPGNPAFELARVNDMASGASSNVSRLSLGCHTGTHVDAPVHFLPGASGVDTLP
ncbi:MAG: cyclase family protein, partial [Chloroflexota bacterium]